MLVHVFTTSHDHLNPHNCARRTGKWAPETSLSSTTKANIASSNTANVTVTQRAKVFRFLLDDINIADLQKVLDDSDNRIVLISDEERDAYFEDLVRKRIETRSPTSLPPIESLSRITGAKILEVVARATPEEPVTVHLEDMELLNDELFMEWAWVVVLDSRVLEASTHGDRYKIVDQKSRFVDVFGCENT